MTGWFTRTATLLLLAFPIFLPSLLLLITILLMADTSLLLSAFQFFLFLFFLFLFLLFLFSNHRIGQLCNHPFAFAVSCFDCVIFCV